MAGAAAEAEKEGEELLVGKVKKGKVRAGIHVIAVMLLIAGLGVLLYPKGKTIIYNQQVRGLQDQFEEQKKADEARAGEPKDYTALYEFLKQENIRLYEEGQKDLSDAFSYEQPKVDFSDYGLQNNQIGFIRIPGINVELPLYLGANNRQMNKGAVHLTGTSYPIGGENTNAIIAAHRGASIPMFRNIHNIRMGDKIYIDNFRETLTYEATEIKIILPTDKKSILIQEGKDMITLISCHPLGKNYQRYVVYCERVK